MPAGLVFIFVVVDLDKRVWRGAVKGLKRPERFCRRLVSQRQVWLDVVVIVSPEGQLPAGIVEAVENLLVQQIVAQAAIEWLDEGILLGLPRIELMPVHVVVVAPFQDRPAGELCPVITDNACELAKDPDQRLQCPRNLCARDGCVGHEAQVLAAAIIVRLPECGTGAMPRTCRTGNAAISVHQVSALLASVSESHAPVCGSVIV